MFWQKAFGIVMMCASIVSMITFFGADFREDLIITALLVGTMLGSAIYGDALYKEEYGEGEVNE